MSHFDDILSKAKHQEGLVATYQVDVPDRSFSYYVKQDKLERLNYGIYRVIQLGHSDQQDLVEAYLWSKEKAIFSHETALYLHNLSDLLPNRVHFTLPPSEEKRDRKLPATYYALHFADIPPEETEWVGAVPVTTIERTLVDSISAGVNPDEVEKAIDQAKNRGMVGDDIERQLIRRLVTR
jgi:predicted transcriptional regulator of viral defense system